jgi:septal ring factor EnvC (AmiA/AmiB activator)
MSAIKKAIDHFWYSTTQKDHRFANDIADEYGDLNRKIKEQAEKLASLRARVSELEADNSLLESNINSTITMWKKERAHAETAEAENAELQTILKSLMGMSIDDWSDACRNRNSSQAQIHKAAFILLSKHK